MLNNFQFDAPRAGLTPEPDGSYIVDQQRAALLDAYYDRRIRDENFQNERTFNFDKWMNDE